MTDDLAALAARIDQLALASEGISAPFTRLARPLLKHLSWQPTVSVVRLEALLETLRTVAPHAVTHEMRYDTRKALDGALAELRDNVVRVERACVVCGRPLVAYASWLRRMLATMARAHRAADQLDDEVALRAVTSLPSVALVAPLAFRAETDAALRGVDEPAPSRSLEMQLGAVDHLLDAARGESAFLDRRRRLLEAARQVLLETSAALPVEPTGAEARRRFIAMEIARLDAVEATGVARDVGLLHQARSALRRGETHKLNAILQVLDEGALARGDERIAARTGSALRTLWNGRDPLDADTRAASQARSAEAIFGADMLARMHAAYEAGRARYAAIAQAGGNESSAARDAWIYLGIPGERATTLAALSVDGCFEVGGALTPMRVAEYELRRVEVTTPTPKLLLAAAQGVEDVPTAVIEDPRMVVLALASGTLLTRRYVRDEPHVNHRTRLFGEVRVYLLDGSTSMIGPRARMRDAVLVSELSTLQKRRREHGRTSRVVLFYCYFTDQVESMRRVDSEATAHAAVGDVLGRVRFGATDIERALIACFQQVREARASDPQLSRAQIVLVTDGQAPVRADVIDHARAGMESLPIGFSVVALGEENPALRALVARQRARGERAFYHFIPDDALHATAQGKMDASPALYLPDDTLPAEPSVLFATVEGLLDEIGTLGRARDVEAMESLDAERLGRADVGLADGEGMTEGERARTEAVTKDRRSLLRRFDRWFPEIPTDEHTEEADATELEFERRDAVIVALASVAEVVAVVGGTDLARRADAIDLLERLLPDARLTPTEYESTLTRFPSAVAHALRAVRDAVAVSRRA